MLSTVIFCLREKSPSNDVSDQTFARRHEKPPHTPSVFLQILLICLKSLSENLKGNIFESRRFTDSHISVGRNHYNGIKMTTAPHSGALLNYSFIPLLWRDSKLTCHCTWSWQISNMTAIVGK